MRSGHPFLGMGCMRLSTESDRDETHAIAVLHAALDAGVTLLDTADAYCQSEAETGHNERLIAGALATRGDRSGIVVATKGGLTRPQGNWVPDGRARHLAAACDASRRALGIDRIPLYQLHAVDPRVPLATSVRALDALKRDGLVDAVGLCNVTVGQIEEARRMTEIASVQVELSLWNDGSILNGVVEYCLAHGILLLAHRPLGGARRQSRVTSDPVLAALAARHGVTAFDVALAWLSHLSPQIVALPGPTRIQTAGALGRAQHLTLTDDEWTQLDERFPAARLLRLRTSRQDPVRSDGEVVLIMGLPGAGKSTLARTFVADGYTRLNRDDAGGPLHGLLPALDRLIASSSSRVVLDNTYLSRRSRGAVIATALQHRLPVRCVWLATSMEDAQVNAATRMVERYGRLLAPEEIRRESRKNTAAFGPGVQFRLQRELEPPDAAEGFSRIDVVQFERSRDPAFSNRAVIVWVDGVLRRSRSGNRTPASVEDIEIHAGRSEVLRRWADAGWLLLGLSWHPEIAEGAASAADVEAGFSRTRELLGVDLPVEYCPHPAGPPICWCRKPLPGLGVVLIERHGLNASQCLYVGAGPQDPGFARRLGFQYRDASEFFERPHSTVPGPSVPEQ